MSPRRPLLLLFAVILAHLSSASLWAQYTRNLYNHSSQSVFCTNPGIICTMTPTTCVAGGSCTVAALGFFTLSATADVRWDFTFTDRPAESDTGSVTTTRDIYYMSRIDVYNLSAGDSVSLAVAPTSIAENGGVATITAIRSAASATVTNVTLDINGGTDSGAATLDSDFTQSGAAAWDGPLQRNVYTFQIPAWSTTGTLTLTGKDDSIVEPDETINFRIYKVDTATWDSTLKTVLIDDDDRKVSLAVNNTSIPETGGAATVTVSVSPVNSAEPVDVSLAFSGTAARPADYTTSLTTITIPAGQSSASATISVAGDSVDEPDETIVIDVTSVTNASESGTQQQTITIVDDDVPQVSLELAGSPFVENNTGLATVTARLDKPSYEIVAVDLGFTGTATNATDYTPSATSINIPIGALSGSMTLTGIPDTLDELDETVIVDITAVTGAVESGTQQVTATIPDDDAPPAVTLSLADSPFAESAGIATVTATLNTASSFPVTVDLGFGGTATNAADYTRSGSSITIDPENLSGTITLNALDDALDEPDETVIVDMTAATNATEAGTQQVTATIADDDDPPSVTLSLAGVPWAESGGSVTVTATLGAVSSFPVTVFLAFSGTATNTVDYTRSASSITIDPGNLSGTITLNALDDTLDELDETVIVDITSATNGMEAGVQQVTASLIDDDVPTVTLGLTGSPLAEAGGVATVTATLSSVSASAVTVHLGFSGTASAADYTASATSIAIDVGATTGSITISGNDDALYELNETVVVDVTTVAGGAIEDTTAGEQQVTATITDDDAPPAVTLSLAGSPLAESGGAASVNATLSGPSGLPVTVTLELSGSATYAADYTTAPLAPISLVIPAGSIGATTTLTAVDDTIDEADETVVVDITGVINGIESGTQQVTATIADDDAPPTVTLSLAGSPIAENAGTATVTVTLSAASANVVTVDLGFGGTATSGVDYTRSGPSITIPPGSLSGTATLTAVNDTTDEPDETVIVDITGVTNGTESGTQQVTATIADDDAPPAVTLSLAGSPFAENAGAATVKALLSGPSGLPVTVTLGLSGSATYAADYTTTPAAPIALVIPSGATEGSLTLTAVGDALDEIDETVVIDITGVTNGIASGPQQVTATITDDDAPPAVTLSLAGSQIAENAGTATVTATLSTASANVVTVDLGFGGTAATGVDYTRSGPSITIPPGSLSGTATLTAVNDTTDEPDETVIVDITGVTNGTESGTQQVTATIADDDAPPAVTLSLAGSPFAENAGAATVKALLSGPSGLPVTVTLGLSGSATYAADYTTTPAAPIALVIPSGATEGSLTLTAVDDALDEIDETVVIDITGVTNGIASGTQQVTATITDDDAPPAVTLSLAGSPIAENAGTATVTATLSAASANVVTVNLGFGGTATNGVEYTRSGPSITIPPGSLSGTATLTAVNDATDEPDETVIVDITGVTNGTESGTQQVTATITDDDAPPAVTLSLAGSPFAENAGTATVTATLSTASANVVTVDLGFGGTATNGVDYTRSGPSITIPPGSLSGTVTLTAVNDATDEPDETVIVDITGVTNGTESGAQQVTATIADDDAPPAVTLSLAGSPIAENAGTATVTATLSAASANVVTVDLGFGGTATTSIDYTRSGPSITIPPGSLSGTVTLTAVNDTTDEPDETVIVDITGVTNGTESGTQQVTATIADDDAPPTVTLSLAGSPFAENAGATTVKALLSGPSGLPVTVTLGLSGSATYAADYTTTPAAPIALVIPSGATEGSLTLTAVDDALDEIDETVVVDITGVTNGTESGTQQVTATITDDDAEPAVSLALAGSPMSEAGGVATVTATLSRPTSRIVTVNLAFAGTATAADYTASATAITIAAGLTSGSITLTAVDDTGAELDETLVVDVAAVTNALEDGTQQVIATITDDDPASLAFATQPSTAVAGEAIAPAVTVQVLDASGRPVPASTASVALAIGSNPAGGTLSGTLTVSAVGGVATFANLVIELSGAGYTLIASSSGLTPATSAPFEITPNAVTTFSGPSTTGTGIVSVSFTGGGAACTFADVSLLNRPPGPDPLPPTSPPGLVFPHGLLRFELGDCERGAAVTFTIVYPEPLPEGTRYWKYGPPASGAAPVWYELPATAISGNRVTFTLTDGGTGDEDGLANGRLRDPGGPAFSSGAIPTLSEWALWLMALMFAGLGLLGIRSSSGS